MDKKIISISCLVLILFIGIYLINYKATYSFIDTDGNTVGEDEITNCDTSNDGNNSTNCITIPECDSIGNASDCVKRDDCSWNYSKGCFKKDTTGVSCDSIGNASDCVKRDDCSWSYASGCTERKITTSHRICLAMADGTYAQECNHFCDTDSSGKVTSDCLNQMYAVCNKWSTIRWNEIEGSNNQGTGLSKEEFASKVFTSTETYYCVAGSSQGSSGSGSGGSTTTSPVDTFTQTPITETKTCSNDTGKSISSCQTAAVNECGDRGYVGCYKADSNACYTYTCKSSSCLNSSLNTHDACVNNAKIICGDKGYVGCTTPNDGECYVSTCADQIKTCTNDNLKNPEACKTSAELACGNRGYTGCTTPNQDECYSYTCNEEVSPEPEPEPTNECSNVHLKDAGACKATAQSDCGDRGYTGCDSADSEGCYKYSCNNVTTGSTTDDNPQTGSVTTAIIILLGLFTFGYSLWYYKKINSLKNM